MKPWQAEADKKQCGWTAVLFAWGFGGLGVVVVVVVWFLVLFCCCCFGGGGGVSGYHSNCLTVRCVTLQGGSKVPVSQETWTH